ncbi:MAG TPA: VanZ family protein, partial [Candidatus Polarisedimenticolaceae bacterium]|nr:VanZ family protein [Candidatus Polarisedimenticolaceae bacterium]
GLSPYRFVGWLMRDRLEWVPLVEYYYRTTPAALYDAGIGLVTFAVWTALFGAATRCSRPVAVLAAMSLATGVEFVQTFVVGRTAGTTDILIAGLGAWAGYTIRTALRLGRRPAAT